MPGTGLTVRLRACAWEAVVQQDTWTVKLAVPAVVGVPVMAPVDEFSDKPAGRAPADKDQVFGVVPPVETSVVE